MEGRPPQAPLALQLVFVGHYLDQVVEQRLASYGLNRTQTMILIGLNHREGIKVHDLRDHARVVPANVTRSLQSLERLGLVERRPHPTDGRASVPCLTETGKCVAAELGTEINRISEEILREVEPQDLACLEKGLVALRRAFGCRHQLSAAGFHRAEHDPASVTEENPDVEAR